MDKSYWIGRKRAAMRMARAATSSEARLIHYDLAGRYSIKAAHALPFMLPDKGPDGEGERAALRLHLPPLLTNREIAERPRPGSRKGPGFGERNGGKQ
jgi:hypothetical protein